MNLGELKRPFVVAVALLLGLHGLALAHTRLVSSEPAANAHLAEGPRLVRLVFSEPVGSRLARITVVAADSSVRTLTPESDPRNVRALIAPVDGLGAGAYRLNWRIVSADGHPIEGTFTFHVDAPAAPADTTPPAPPPAPPTSEPASWGPSVAGAPIVPATLRGLAIGTLMAAAGLLLFFVLHQPGMETRPGRILTWVTAAATGLVIVHFAAWLMNISPEHRLDSGEMAAAFGTMPGRVELARVMLTVLALWAIALARRPGLALIFAGAALLLSGASGHPAGMQPLWAIPAKALHLAAASAWFGGLLWIVLRERDDLAVYVDEAKRVSSIALPAVLVVALSGIVQARLFLPSTADLWSTTYGLVALAKAGGLGVLVIFGARHRHSLPRLRDLPAAADLRASVGREVGVMALVILLGGFLAYIPPAEPDTFTATAGPIR